jgi:ABC-type thiamin/hydroxymethylpyrimidine transport system permease subunit
MQQVLSLLVKYVYHVRPAVRRIVSNIITWLAFQPNIWLIAQDSTATVTDQSVITKPGSSGTVLTVLPAAVEVCLLTHCYHYLCY